ncbi:MAG: hypothetical protein GEV09_12695 [Pseudonocardiaceae bacterium]|nr:hypothetical protein [Pseudonocardiaceae bacterium]
MFTVSSDLIADGVAVRDGDHTIVLVSDRLTHQEREVVAADLHRLLQLVGGQTAAAWLPAGRGKVMSL